MYSNGTRYQRTFENSPIPGDYFILVSRIKLPLLSYSNPTKSPNITSYKPTPWRMCQVGLMAYGLWSLGTEYCTEYSVPVLRPCTQYSYRYLKYVHRIELICDGIFWKFWKLRKFWYLLPPQKTCRNATCPPGDGCSSQRILICY